ncbi:6718_t:CDS:1, partial [Funneliformis geosporum]
MTSEAQYNKCSTDINFAMPEDCVDKLNWSMKDLVSRLFISFRSKLGSKYNFNLDVSVKIVNMLSVE